MNTIKILLYWTKITVLSICNDGVHLVRGQSTAGRLAVGVGAITVHINPKPEFQRWGLESHFYDGDIFYFGFGRLIGIAWSEVVALDLAYGEQE